MAWRRLVSNTDNFHFTSATLTRRRLAFWTASIPASDKNYFTLQQATRGPEGEYKYSSTLSLTSALDGVGDQRHARTLILGKDPEHIVQEAGWVSGLVWRGAENLDPTGIRFADRPARNYF